MVNDNRVFNLFSWSTKGDPIKKIKKKRREIISAYPIALDGYNKYFDIAVKGVKHCYYTVKVKI